MRGLLAYGLASASFISSVLGLSVTSQDTSHPAVANLQARSKSINPKYFYEAGGGQLYGHYDKRYYTGAPVKGEIRSKSLHNLIGSYLYYLKTIHVTSWLAHGTLLGWYWNGEILPWDNDLDVQVWAEDLYKLAKYNQTMYHYTTVNMPTTKPTATKPKSKWRIPIPAAPEIFERKYLLDVNPYHVTRDGGDFMNVIDARWIDTTTGLFIDITGLSDTGQNEWTCKNFHRYPKAQMAQMINTMFEGVQAIVPVAYDTVLTSEYGFESLIRDKFNKYTFLKGTGEWVKDGEVGLG